MRRPARLTSALIFVALSLLLNAAFAQTSLVVEATLNREDKGTLLLVERVGRLFLDEKDAREWRLRVPDGADLTFQGRRFFLLTRLGIEVVNLDRRSLRLELTAPANAFEASAVNALGPEYPVTRAATGGFFNYDLLGTRFAGRAAVDGAFEAGAFSDIGVLVHSFILRNMWSDDAVSHRYERLATTFRHDWADATTTLEVGDSISRPGATGRALRFGGAALRSNFSLRPGFVPQPLPSFVGSATVPSTVEVFVQNQLRSTTEVPPGPFTLNNVPIVLGGGDARIVVRDALGREQTVTSTFYAASGLLRPGLSDFAFAAGRLRAGSVTGFSQYGNDYASGLWRQGISRNVTVEGRFETEAGVARVAGVAIDVGSGWGEIEAALAVNGRDGTRGFGALGYRYQDFDNTIGLRWEQAQNGFRFAGDTAESPTPRSLVTVNVSRRVSPRWNLGALLIDLRRQDGERTRSANLSAFVTLAPGLSALLAANRVVTNGRDTTGVGVFMTYALGLRSSASASVEGGADARRTAGVQQALPIDEGWGYRVAVTDARVRREEAAATVQMRAVTLTADFARDAQTGSAWRLGASGSAATIGSVPLFARAINDSFALVQLDDFADVPVLLNNQVAGRTDARGQLILPRLSAYQPNEIRVDADELPADARIGKDREFVVAPYRSGVRIEPDVKRVASAIVRLRTAKGVPIPAGAGVRVEPDAQATNVAQRGEFYVTGRPGRKRAEVELRGQSCSIDFDLPAERGRAFHSIGPLECIGIQP